MKQKLALTQPTDDAVAATAAGEPRPPSFVKMKNGRPASASSLSPRERLVMAAALALPCDSLTPSATMAALVRQGLDLSPSTISYVLQCLERKGLLRLARKR
ncbi:MAG: MarR family transcriptional regulator [Comamonadaceae bacterium]|nr:MAG: MarR family transcriptional regulator [Comamonadaceae bacterium]